MSKEAEGPTAIVRDREGVVQGAVTRRGDHLKVRYEAKFPEDGKGWVEFNPAYLHVELNGQPVMLCQELTIIVKDGVPKATLSITLDKLEVDADTLVALAAIVEFPKEEK